MNRFKPKPTQKIATDKQGLLLMAFIKRHGSDPAGEMRCKIVCDSYDTGIEVFCMLNERGWNNDLEIDFFPRVIARFDRVNGKIQNYRKA